VVPSFPPKTDLQKTYLTFLLNSTPNTLATPSSEREIVSRLNLDEFAKQFPADTTNNLAPKVFIAGEPFSKQAINNN